MNYEQIEIIIRNEHPQIWRTLLSLHHTYKNKITRKIAEECGVFDCHEVAYQVVQWVRACPYDIRDGFSLMSMTYDELREYQRITGQKLTRRANLLRRNLRRILNIRPEDDLFQQQFDSDKLESEKTYIVRYDSKETGTGWTAHDAKKHEQRKRYRINHSIAKHLDDFAVNFLNYEGLFLSLSLPPEYHFCSFEEAKAEINRRWTNIRRRLKYRNILHLGMSVIELQRDETPHYHIQLYVNLSDKEYVESVILQEFPNENDRRDNAIQSIWDALGVIGYCLKDSGKTDTYISFIGLQKDIKSRYDNVYHNRKHKDLSDWRISKSRRMMSAGKPDGQILLMIRGFADERLNLLSARHPDFYHVQNDIQRLQVTYIHAIHFRVFKNFCNTLKEETAESCHTIRVTAVFCHFLYFVATQVYVYQEGILPVCYFWECEKSRGQPPPLGRGKGLINPVQWENIRIISRLAQKRDIKGIGAESHEISDIND